MVDQCNPEITGHVWCYKNDEHIKIREFLTKFNIMIVCCFMFYTKLLQSSHAKCKIKCTQIQLYFPKNIVKYKNKILIQPSVFKCVFFLLKLNANSNSGIISIKQFWWTRFDQQLKTKNISREQLNLYWDIYRGECKSRQGSS